MGNFIKTSITCSHTGGIDEGSGGEMKVGILGGGRAGGGGGRGLMRGGRGQGCVRGHKATGGGGHDGG